MTKTVTLVHEGRVYVTRDHLDEMMAGARRELERLQKLVDAANANADVAYSAGVRDGRSAAEPRAHLLANMDDYDKSGWPHMDTCALKNGGRQCSCGLSENRGASRE